MFSLFKLPRLACVSGALLLCLALTGCVHRRMTIRSDPPGARVFLEDKEIGFTPVSHDFTYYGTREITLVKDGYETKTVYQPVQRPWYQYLPFEFFADNLSPMKINNRHEFMYQLEPMRIVPNEETLGRAYELRNAAQIPDF